MTRRPPRSTRTVTLFPYTTLFRSGLVLPTTAPVVLVVCLAGGLLAGVTGWLGARRNEARFVAARGELGRRTTSLVTDARSEEHTSELKSLMRISYAVFCLKKKIKKKQIEQSKQYQIKCLTRK